MLPKLLTKRQRYRLEREFSRSQGVKLHENTYFRLTMRARFTLALIILFSFIQFLGGAQSTSTERNLRTAIRDEKNGEEQFLKIIALGNYYKTHNLKRADSIRGVLTTRSSKMKETFRIRALLFSAEVNELRGNQDAYYRDVLACLPYLSTEQPVDIGFMINRQLGYYYCSTLNFKKADQYLRAAEAIVRSARKYGDVAITNTYLALNFMYQNQKDSAIFYTNKAIQFARRTTDKQALTMCFNTQARIYDYFGQVELSVAKNINALQLATEMNNKYMLAKIHLEIGHSQRMILDLTKAENSFKLSYDFAKSIVDRRQMGLALSNLGTVYFDRRDYAKAIKTTENAIDILSNLQDLNGLGEAHDNLGVIHRERKEYTLAATNFNKALVYYESTGNKEKIAGVYHNVGTVFQKQKKYKNALIYLERSIAIREQFGSKNQIYHTFRILSDVYGDIGKTKEAMRYLQRYVNYVDSNSTLQAATKIAELSEQYRMEQRERLIVSQRDSLEKQQQERTLTATKLENSQLRNNFQTYIIIGFIIIITLAGIIGFYRWNQTKIKQQQREAEMSQTLLRTQMNPHFIFNAMSVIQSYIYENDTRNSTKFLVNFSRLMRLILENSPKEFIPIETEEEILQKYLETQKLRFEDRFEFEINVSPEIVTEHAMIPPMITQPFIENAIEHGQLHTIEGGFIHVTMLKQDGMLQITIEDNGIGRKGSEQNKKSSTHRSMAMQITSDRIDNLNKKYKTDGKLVVEDFNKKLETGTKVLISLPYKEETPLTAAL